MALGNQAAADRVERFLDAHPDGRLVVCVGSASVSGIVWLAERTRRRPVTLLIGDLKSRNFAKATDADRRAALDFVDRSDVSVRNWYRTQRSGQGRSEAHLKVWTACDAHDTPQAFLVGSANLTMAGLRENVELMAQADATEHPYLRQTLHELLDKSWDAKDRLTEWIEGDDAPAAKHAPREHRTAVRHRDPRGHRPAVRHRPAKDSTVGKRPRLRRPRDAEPRPAAWAVLGAVAAIKRQRPAG